MSRRLGQAVLIVSGMGFPLTQLAIRHLGLRGAAVVEGVCGGLLVRDATMIASGVPDRLRRGPALLLWLEAAAAGLAVLAGLRPLISTEARAGASQVRPDAVEALRRLAVGALFGLHTWRFRIYLQPGHGLRAPG